MDKPWIDLDPPSPSGDWELIVWAILLVLAINGLVAWLVDRKKRPPDKQ